MSTISVISVVRNEEKYIKRMLSSVSRIANQIVIVDQQSEDRTKEFAEEFCESHALPYVYEMDDRVGYAELSRQKAIDLATSEYILLLDGDEVLVDTAVDDILELKGDYYNLSRKTVIHHDFKSCIEYVSHDQMRYAKNGLAYHSDNIHFTMQARGRYGGLIHRCILELKTAVDTLEDMRRYESIQHQDFQVWFIERLESCLTGDIPDTPYVPPYWKAPRDW